MLRFLRIGSLSTEISSSLPQRYSAGRTNQNCVILLPQLNKAISLLPAVTRLRIMKTARERSIDGVVNGMTGRSAH
jgi:hypothetical protein